MTRVPQDGKTKTRLLSVLKPEECRELHEAFLSDMAENLHPEDADIFISYLDDCPDAAERIQDFFPLAAGYLPQRGETLGDKMLDAFETVLASGYERAVLTGTDLPELSNEILNDAFLALRDHDLVLNETTDHGYYLVGMKKTQNIFHIDVYGSGEVFEKTLKNAVDLGLKIYCGKMLMDIDTREDLHAAKAAYECGDFSLWKHTAAFCEKYKEK
ncbi:MAG: TIGR04282 family arsenosugar biosynthesis glycosyltransferase [Eubacteriales bacterium]|nr:TIGR04282 family arsenosugar biosynthesis glycosyltransferase [Eubacteriales bacterium]